MRISDWSSDVCFFRSTYNGLVTLKNRTSEAWSDIDVQLKRRYDLIPNLMETVKGYAAQEKEVFTKVTEARAKAMQAQTLGNRKSVVSGKRVSVRVDHGGRRIIKKKKQQNTRKKK